MARVFVWPNDDGWPYPDGEDDVIDLTADSLDDDALAVRTDWAHLLVGLDPLERQLVAARFGLDGRPARSMKQLHHDTGLPREDLKLALGSGLAKLRASLAG
jgi:DNA-directed RNA polymerase sigma subunit (sigma70/sigma32)